MFQKRVNVGLDIGSFSVKCAVVEVDRGRIRHLWQAELLPERHSHAESLDESMLQERVGDMLRTLAAGFPSLPRTVTTALQGEGTICHYLELPQLSPNELETAVPAVARKYIPFPLETVVVSYVTVPPLGVEERKSGVFMVAACRSAVESRRKLLERCGLEVNRLDLTKLALVREFSRNHEPGKDRITALLHVGFALTQMIVVRGRYPYYARDIDVGGRDFTYAFQTGAQVPWSEAEALKREYSVTEQTFVAEPTLVKWIDEIRRTLGHFEKSFPGVAVDTILLSGGVAGWDGLGPLLSEHTGLPVEVDGWRQVRAEGLLSNNAGAYKVAVGLALEE